MVRPTFRAPGRGSGLDPLLRRYSSWFKLQTLVAWLMRFVDYIANKNGPLKSARISIPEMRKSTEKIVQIVQRQYFSEEIDCLTDGRQVKGHSKLSNLSPVLIEGTIRVGGRIRHAPIPFDAIHPMILPRDHPVSTLIVPANNTSTTQLVFGQERSLFPHPKTRNKIRENRKK